MAVLLQFITIVVMGFGEVAGKVLGCGERKPRILLVRCGGSGASIPGASTMQ